MTYDKGMSLRILCFCSLFQVTTTSATTWAEIEGAIDGDQLEISGTVDFFTNSENQVITISSGKSLSLKSNSGAELNNPDNTNLKRFFYVEGGRLTLNGITLKMGRYEYGEGAAIFIGHGSDVTLTDCVFKQNNAFAGKGGAIYQEGSSSLYVAGCTFYGNLAGYGGAIFVLSGSLTVTNCIFGAEHTAEQNSARFESEEGGIAAHEIHFEGDLNKYTFIGTVPKFLYCKEGSNGVCPAPNSNINGDPHLQFADGGSADFRGSHNGIYNMLSSDGISVNALFREQDFYQSASGIEFARPGSKQGEKFLVHGTFIFEAYTTLRTSSGRLLHLRTEAAPFSSANVAFVENNVPVSQLDEHNERVVDNIKITTKDGVATIETPEWVVLCKIISTDTSHFLNLSFKSLAAAAAAAHGIIGQSYDHDGLAVDGAKDVYNSVPGGETTTTAQAEGAIEGHHSDYLMESPFATTYKYSLFNNKGAAVRGIRKLANTRVDRERRKLAFLLQRMAGKENVVGAE